MIAGFPAFVFRQPALQAEQAAVELSRLLSEHAGIDSAGFMLVARPIVEVARDLREGDEAFRRQWAGAELARYANQSLGHSGHEKRLHRLVASPSHTLEGPTWLLLSPTERRELERAGVVFDAPLARGLRRLSLGLGVIAPSVLALIALLHKTTLLHAAGFIGCFVAASLGSKALRESRVVHGALSLLPFLFALGALLWFQSYVWSGVLITVLLLAMISLPRLARREQADPIG